MARKKTKATGTMAARREMALSTVKQVVPPGWCVPNSPDPKKRCKKPRATKKK